MSDVTRIEILIETKPGGFLIKAEKDGIVHEAVATRKTSVGKRTGELINQLLEQ